MARTLRGLGVAAPPDATVAYAAALAEVGVHRRSVHLLGRPRHARAPPRGRARLRPRLRRRLRGPHVGRRRRRRRAGARDRSRCWSTPTRQPPDGDGDDPRRSTVPPSPCAGPTASSCATRTSPRCSPAELDEAHRLMADLRLVGARRASRRQRPTQPPARPDRRGRHHPPGAAHRRRAAAHRPPPGRRPAAPGRAALRRVRLDGGLRPGAGALRPRRRGRARAGRGVHARHALHPHHPRAALARPRRRARRGGRRGGGLVRRHPPRARACARSTSGGACGAWHAARWS